MSWPKCHSGRHKFSVTDGTAELDQFPHKVQWTSDGRVAFTLGSQMPVVPTQEEVSPNVVVLGSQDLTDCEPSQLSASQRDVECPIDSAELALLLPERIKIGSSIWASRW